MSYRRKRPASGRYRSSRYAAFRGVRGSRNVRRGTRIRRGDESYGGAVYRYYPQVDRRFAESKWMLWINDHQAVYPVDSNTLSDFAWGNQNDSYSSGTQNATPYLMPFLQKKYVYLDDPWYCPMVNQPGDVWNKRVSSAIMLKRMQCCFNVRPIQWQLPDVLLPPEYPSMEIRLGYGKNESLVSGTFRWWLVLDTQCSGTRLRNYDVGPVLTTVVSGAANYIFDYGYGYVSTLNELNRGRFRIVAVKDFEVCGSVYPCPITFKDSSVSTPWNSRNQYLFVPKSKQYDFSIDLNIPLEWSGFSSTHDESDQTYTTNRLFMVGAFITGQGFQSNFHPGTAITGENQYLPAVDCSMFIKTFFDDA